VDNITLLYIDSSYTIQSKEFTVLKVKGFDPIDNTSDYPDAMFRIIDGSIIVQNIGIRRNFTIEVGVTNYTNRLFCANYFYATTKWIQFAHDGFLETISVVNDSGKFQTEWLNNVHTARYVVLNLQDAVVFDAIPQPNANPATTETNLYLKKKVLITGYVGNPESFTTNSGKLVSCDAPAGVYPAFDDTLQKFYISVNGQVYQDCHFHVTALESETAGNLTFSVERSDAGNPSGDGSYYADIAIFEVSIL
jgi:hypothetical protein